MELKELEQMWAALGDVDPFWAVLSDPRYKYGRWDVEEFYRTGDEEVEEALGHLVQMGHKPQPGRCLEFGCGVGRCSNGLSKWFERYDGVDISEPMLALARHYHDDERLHYHHNTRDDLSIFEDATFDLVYCRRVLQHIPPPHALGYVSEFMRVLKPGGIALFQLPSDLRRFDEEMFAAHLELASRPGAMAPGRPCVLRVRVRNDSGVPWPAGLVVGNHWRVPSGDVICWDDARTLIPRAVDPREATEVELSVVVPDRPGRYLLEIDVVAEGLAWFAESGSETLRLEVTVRRPMWPARRPGRTPVREEPPAYGMWSVPREQVVELVEERGAKVGEVVEDDLCGPGWTSYLYTTLKHGAAR